MGVNNNNNNSIMRSEGSSSSRYHPYQRPQINDQEQLVERVTQISDVMAISPNTDSSSTDLSQMRVVETREKGFLENFPPEVAMLVFSHLDLRDLDSIRQTCKGLKVLVDEFIKPSKLFESHFGKPLKNDSRPAITKELYDQYLSFEKRVDVWNSGPIDHDPEHPRYNIDRFIAEYLALDPTLRRSLNLQVKVFGIFLNCFDLRASDQFGLFFEQMQLDQSLQDDLLHLAKYFPSFEPAPNWYTTPLREQTRIECAKKAVSVSAQASQTQLERYEIKNQTVLTEIIVEMINKNTPATFAQGTMFSFQYQVDFMSMIGKCGITNQECGLKIATALLENDLLDLNRIDLIGLDQSNVRSFIETVAQRKDNLLPYAIAKFGIQDPVELTRMAKILAATTPNHLSKNIANFNIQDQTTLIEIAEIAALNGALFFIEVPPELSQIGVKEDLLGHYGIQDPAEFDRIRNIALTIEKPTINIPQCTIL